MNRKKKHSTNWNKAKAKVTKTHSKISNVRRDFLHKASTTISRNHAVVSIEVPGKRVAQKSGLNRSILDQGWGEFRRQLTYKMEWTGGYLIAVPPEYTSQTCPCCGHIAVENRRTQALFQCVECGYENHADVERICG